MLSRSSKYAIRAVIFISNYSTKHTKIGSKQIADELQIPAPFLAKILQELTKKNIISSLKGPNGGFYLTSKNNKKTFFDVVESIDGFQKIDSCFLGQKECNNINPCIIHHLYYPFKNELLDKLKTKTIVEMADEYAKNNNLLDVVKLQ
ncbi:RrF2 family transcriptional regulator [Polaribacter uvawellassae]|uniref:RrF2 family transcriptional regulator n=1 Tax=Polaribacter uvawellassae TaxID=3133495 RepID=UPI00321AE305